MFRTFVLKAETQLDQDEFIQCQLTSELFQIVHREKLAKTHQD